MAGLAPQTIRQPPPAVPEAEPDIIVDMDNGDDVPEFSDDGAIRTIEHGDGAVTISLDGRPLSDPKSKTPEGWFSNLCEEISPDELSRIADELIRGVEDDLASRKEWTESIATGIQLLGLKLEIPGLQGASDGAPVEGMSKVRDSLLLEAVLRFQSNARSELLPSDGPVKVRSDSQGGSTAGQDSLAEDLELDLNHYLTAVASEYYPDTDRMLLKLGFAGMTFKKVYFCPLRMRPVSETVDADDLIVNNAATDLANAKRVTHKVLMRPSTVKRLQILGVYRDVSLSDPQPAKLDAVQREQKNQQGVSQESTFPEDRDREIYECYCELDIKGFEHKWKGKVSGLEIPYRVTIDVSTRQVLSVVRNYDEGRDLPEARETFVAYIFVPGLGFYAIGLLHILGNTTNALTAATREMLDCGMYANFPGFLFADTGGRQNTNIFRVPPGGGAPIKTNGMPIAQAVMPLPYNTQQMPALMELVSALRQNGQRIGGSAELQVGEGRPDAPVGTTLAMIEQATKIENAVHKRLHAAQAKEFQLLVECFREHPDSFLRASTPSKTTWSEETFLKALDDHDLVPQADPNTASHNQRVAKIMALVQLSQLNQSLWDPIAIAKAALSAMGWNDPTQFMAPPSAMGRPPPELLEAQSKMAAEQTEAQAKTTTAQARMLEAKAKVGQGLAGAQPQPPDPTDIMGAKAKLMDAETKRHALGVEVRQNAVEDRNRDQDRQAKREETFLNLEQEILRNPEAAEQGAREVKPITQQLGAKP